jgi:spoIIIJ-associated protein
MAKQSATLVEREGRPVSLPPMSAYERRVVHIVLKDHPVVATQSIGTGEVRKVTVRRLDQMLPEL